MAHVATRHAQGFDFYVGFSTSYPPLNPFPETLCFLLASRHLLRGLNRIVIFTWQNPSILETIAFKETTVPHEL